MKILHLIIVLLLFFSSLINGKDVKWECMKDYYDEIVFPYIVEMQRDIIKDGFYGNLFCLARGGDLKYAEEFSLYCPKRDVYMPLIREYNKAWHEMKSFQYEKAIITLKSLLRTEYFQKTRMNIIRFIASWNLTHMESYIEKNPLSETRYYQPENANAESIFLGQNITHRSLLPNLNRSRFTNKCYCMIEEFHQNAANLKEVSNKINMIEDSLTRKFCMYLFYYFYEIGYDVNVIEAITLVRKIDEAEAYFILARVIDSLDGTMCNYDVWLTKTLLYAQAAKKGYLSAVYIFDNLPPMSKSAEKEMMQKLWDIWDAYPEQDKKREQRCSPEADKMEQLLHFAEDLAIASRAAVE